MEEDRERDREGALLIWPTFWANRFFDKQHKQQQAEHLHFIDAPKKGPSCRSRLIKCPKKLKGIFSFSLFVLHFSFTFSFTFFWVFLRNCLRSEELLLLLG